MAKNKYLRFQNQRKIYLGRFFLLSEYINISPEDLLLKEFLTNIDENLFFDNKLLMFRFKKRYANFKPEFRKIII